MGSFSMPFYTMKHVEVEQPVFSANYMHGYVVNELNGEFWWGWALVWVGMDSSLGEDGL